jgi:hypothetical protein
MHAPPRAVCYQTYFAASAITTTVKITNAAICTQKLLVNPCSKADILIAWANVRFEG